MLEFLVASRTAMGLFVSQRHRNVLMANYERDTVPSHSAGVALTW